MSTTARALKTFLSLTLVVGVLAIPNSALAAKAVKFPWNGPAPRVKPGRIVVTFRPGTTRAERLAAHAGAGARVSGPSHRIDVVPLPAGLSPWLAIRRYEADPNVLAAEPDRFATFTEIPNDPLFNAQWALENHHQFHPITETGDVAQDHARGTAGVDVGAVDVWDQTTLGSDVVVAILDSGVDIDHPDLLNSMWVNAAEQAGLPGVDDDGNGYVDDVHGWDFRGDDPNPSPGAGLAGSHGTHVAGIVAAERGNGIGIAGICGACRIMALRFDLSLGQELRAIRYAIDNGADIINMSFATPVWSPAERSAIRQAGNAGILTVAAAGNSSLDNDIPTYVRRSFAPAFPASYTLPTILSVAASNHHDWYGLQTECDLSTIPRWRCAFTSWGHDSVDLAAPGVDIVSTVAPGLGDVGDGYQVLDGTSMASPLAAGTAGLVLHEHQAYGPLDLKNALMNSALDTSALVLQSAWADLTGVSKSPMRGAFTRTDARLDARTALNGSTVNATHQSDGNIDGARLMSRARMIANVAWPQDVNDVFRKRLVAGNRYRITLDGPPRKDFDLFVWTPNATEIHQFTAGCFRRGGACPALKAVSGGRTADEQVTFSVTRTGVFFIEVEGWYSGGRFTLTVRRL
jgi:subtilisin family serine protease